MGSDTPISIDHIVHRRRHAWCHRYYRNSLNSLTFRCRHFGRGDGGAGGGWIGRIGIGGAGGEVDKGVGGGEAVGVGLGGREGSLGRIDRMEG